VTEAVASQVRRGLPARFFGFLADVRNEIRKVTWPTREELRRATLVIIVFVIFIGFVIGLMDWVLQLVFVRGIPALFR
jgi:preprotein translocase subunit SecE